MPFVNIKVTGGAEAPTAEQKAQLISGVTELLQRVLHKNPATTVVIIEEVPMTVPAASTRSAVSAPKNIHLFFIPTPPGETSPQGNG